MLMEAIADGQAVDRNVPAQGLGCTRKNAGGVIRDAHLNGLRDGQADPLVGKSEAWRRPSSEAVPPSVCGQSQDHPWETDGQSCVCCSTRRTGTPDLGLLEHGHDNEPFQSRTTVALQSHQNVSLHFRGPPPFEEPSIPAGAP